MLSLEERINQRAKRKALEEKARKVSPTQGNSDDVSDNEFNAVAWVADTVDNIVAQLGDLTAEQLSAVKDAEAGRKNRVSVMNAIAEDEKRRESGSAGWNNNAG